MTLPEIQLDELRFQDLVTECRKQISRSCPEWTEANVSDPGITLIELFAEMIDQLSYRINRIPEKLQVALLGLLDVKLYPPTVATAELRFSLAEPPRPKPGGTEKKVTRWPPKEIRIPAGTEVSTPRESGEPIVFRTRSEFTIAPVTLTQYWLHRSGSARPIMPDVQSGVASPGEMDGQAAFSTPGQAGDCVLLGFDRSVERLIVRLYLECVEAAGVSVQPDNPPLVWEVYTGGWSGQPATDDRHFPDFLRELTQMPTGSTSSRSETIRRGSTCGAGMSTSPFPSSPPALNPWP
ncbi:MAG: hypothetical protein ACLP0J_31115 [Solirubrobacteraceae bacterium]